MSKSLQVYRFHDSEMTFGVHHKKCNYTGFHFIILMNLVYSASSALFLTSWVDEFRYYSSMS